MYVLDTDAVTFHQVGQVAIVQRICQLPPDEFATTVITMAEQMQGRLARINRQQPIDRLIDAYARLFATQRYFCRMNVLPFDVRAADIYQGLVADRIRIGAQDLRIAAIALARQAIIVTSNRRHFDRVPDLKIEDWSL